MSEAVASANNNYGETTKRPVVSSLEAILGEPIKILDHGFIRVVDYMGDDSAIVQAARVSYGKGTKTVNQDKGLINYLMRHWHTTPFEMCDIKLHVKLPIFIARQWIRHRTASVNEYSARYSILDKEFYIPEPHILASQSTVNKQGREEGLTAEEQQAILDILKGDANTCYKHYMEMLNQDDETGEPLDPSKSGLTRELARMNLNLNYYTQWYWKINLHNLLNFVRLRADSHAQYEIRVYADAILDIISKWVPHTYDAFMNYRMNAQQFSHSAMQVLKRMLAGEKVDFESSGLTKREWQEFQEAINN